MKKIIFSIISLVFLLSSCSNSADLKKIEELEKQIEISSIENEKMIINIIKWEWFTPHYALRKIIFNVDKTYYFHLNEWKIIRWNFSIKNSTIEIYDWEKNILLEVSWWIWDDINFYMTNSIEWEYFIKN